MRFRRTAQAVFLAIFLLILAGAGPIAGSDLFLRMDPVLIGVAALAGRALAWAFIPALIVFVSAVLFGRIFCGYICPMGTTIDATDTCISRPRSIDENSRPISPRLKYYILAFIAGAALTGVTFVFWAAPLSLITRFYAMVVYPVLLLIIDAALSLLYPLASLLDIRPLMFAEIPNPRYSAQIFVLMFFAAVFAASRFSPRFWCRYLCPSGAFLGMVSRKPLIRRHLESGCNQCGICADKCPMGAIDRDSPQITRHSECIVCRQCAQICPQNAIYFGTGPIENIPLRESVSPGRRQFLVSGLAGAATAAVTLTGLHVVAGDEAEKGVVRPARLIRPPGALPEFDFLAACVRCGQCMSACPTNTLQPVWFEAGFLGIFSPAVTPRRKYCDPECTACGRVCPTGAISRIRAQERAWVKIGTAVIYRQQCLAWEYEKSCMVCDEVCPYDAVEFEKRPDLAYPVPHVIEDKCSGCGHCEHACPVYNRAAIVVTPMNALRLSPGESFEYEAKSRGFDLRLEPKDKTAETRAGPYPGSEIPDAPPRESKGLPPGFDEGG
ncbi:MAG: 4Fe-4S binding protein [Desulfobacteraceae bacterium]|nr:4Fe-4S binding protein [Desulfobacteraceae bacterium]